MRASFLERTWPTLLVAALCLGIVAASVVRPSVAVAGVAVLAASTAGAAATGGRRLACALLALGCIGLAWGSLRLEALDRSLLSTRLGETAPARVVVTGPARHSRFALRLPAVVIRFGGEVVRERVLLELPPERAPPQGAILDVRARPVEPRGPETGFDERGWLARRGVHVVLRGGEPRIVGRRGGIGGVADRLRAHIEQTIAAGAEGERARLLAGIVLGEEAGLGTELRGAFEASGLLHLLAVSGQNVGIVALGIVAAARLAGIGRLVGEVLAIVGVLLYALAAGWQPSVVRAAVAGVLVSLAWLRARPRDRWHAMALGALVLLAWMPETYRDPGFQLSFAAVAAIYVLVPRLRSVLEGYPIPQGVADVSSLAVACGVVTAPIVWLHFGSIAVWTVPANVLAEPAMPPLIALVLAAAVLEPVAPPVAVALTWLAGFCAAWIAGVAREVSGWPVAELRSGVAFAALVGCVAAGVLLARLPPYRRRRGATLVLLLCLLASAGWWAARTRPAWTPPTGLRATFLDVGQGDAILLEAPGGAALVDQGPPEADVAGQLRQLGIRSLAVLVLTHPQRDHIGGAADVLRRLRVETVLDPVLPSPSEDHAAARAAARERGVRVVVARAGTRLRVGELELEVLWPDGPGFRGEDPNRRATVLLARYGSTELLLPADAESDVTARLDLPPVEVLKVAHHGSDDAGLPALLRDVRPQIAVVSVGEGNDYGHPTDETLGALRVASGVATYRTDVHGRIVVRSDGRSLTVESERGGGPE